LPRDIDIERVPFLGATWLSRDVGYWFRRAGVTLLALLILMIWSTAIGDVLERLDRVSHVGFWAALAATVACSLVTGVAYFRALQRARAQPGSSRQRSPNRQMRHAGLGAVVGVLLIPIGLIALPWLSYGVVAVCLMRSFAPVSDLEVSARRRLAETIHAAGLDHADPLRTLSCTAEVESAVG
jgi:uncharacterized membrane protein